MGTFELTDIVTAAGVVIVVVLLVMLAMMIRLNSKIGSMTARKIDASETPPYVSASASSADGIPGEIIAVIAAAVAGMYEGTGTTAVIKSVRRSEIGLPIWGKAGLFENTRPF